MRKIRLIYLKNQMLVANSIANFIGVFWVRALMLRFQETFAKEILEYPIAHWTNALFSPFAFSFVTVMTVLYEKPIRYYLNALFRRTSFSQAKEVQQNLLPKSNLKINGIDIAGKSIYCDETGGDYYDFIIIDNATEQKVGVAIGDVSGHGIPSADATQIMDIIFDTLDKFKGGMKIEDDITSVVIKMQN